METIGTSICDQGKAGWTIEGYPNPLTEKECALIVSNYRDYSSSFNNMVKLKWKLELLKQLVLLTHPSVSREQVGTLQLTQWNEFVKEFPDEGELLK